MSRVAVTTDRFEQVAGLYEEAGLSPVSLPCVRLESAGASIVEDARTAAAGVDVVIVTSPRVVAMLWPDGAMPEVDVVAVGSKTAAAVRSAGGRVVVVGDAGLYRVVQLAQGRLEGAVVMLGHAAGSDPLALERLRVIAGRFDDRVLYGMVPIAPDPIGVDAVSFASPSAVAGWRLSRDLEGLVAGAIGATTARAVSAIRPPDVVSKRPWHGALARQLASILEVR